MKAETYIKHLPNYDQAFEWMTMKNRACQKAGNTKDTYCVVPGPQDDYAVVDLSTAIDLGLGYVWNTSSTGWVNNPF